MQLNKMVILFSLRFFFIIVKYYLLLFLLQHCSNILEKHLEGLSTPPPSLLTKHTAVFNKVVPVPHLSLDDSAAV